MKLEISQTGSRRIHAGLSWDPITAGGGSLSKKELAASSRRNFPYKNALICGFLFNALAFLFYVSLANRWEWPLNTMNALLFTGCATLLYLIFLSIFMKTANFMYLSDGHSDNSARDRGFRHFDLDLHCFVFDQEKNFLFEINPENDKLISAESAIYHSAEDPDGGGVYDDETIHFETTKIPDNYAYILVCVSNDCHYEFDKITNAKIRLADSMTDKDYFSQLLSSPDKDGYVFGLLHKHAENWHFKLIDTYTEFSSDWQKSLFPFLNAASH